MPGPAVSSRTGALPTIKSIIIASHGLLCSRRLGPAAVRGYCRSETRIRTSNILINSQALYR